MPPFKASDEDYRNLAAYLSSLVGIMMGEKAAPMETSGAGPPFERIAHAKPGDWPTYHGQIGGNRFSGLDQINVSNAKSLAVKWVFPVNQFALEVTPLVVDGVMFLSGPNQVFALDARAGRTIWHYQRDRSKDVTGDPAMDTNRGLRVLGDRVFMVTDNGAPDRAAPPDRAVALGIEDAGRSAKQSLRRHGGASCSEGHGDRGDGRRRPREFADSFRRIRPIPRERVWRFWTTPKPGEPNSETWKGTALARFGGGGAAWMTGTYDPETDTIFWGVGNPYPAYNGDERQGDNLYSDSVIALKPDSGELKWYYQFTPHDLHDWDAGQTPMVVDAPFRGRDRKLLIQANRNGFFYVLDRTNGELLLAEKFVDRLSWASGVGKDGRPILLPGAEPVREGTRACPSVLGATNWPSMSYNPGTKLFYLEAREACGIYVKPPAWNPKPIPLEPGQQFLRALDIETGKRVWEVPQIGPADSWGGVLSTAGGVVFFGEDSGAFAAVDARTGKALWQIQTNASSELGDGHSWRASPMTFLAGGKQYVAVAAGPNILCFGLP